MPEQRETRGSIIPRIVFCIGFAMALFHVWTLNFKPLSPGVFRPTHLLSVCLLVFLLYDHRGKVDKRLSWDKILLIVLSIASMVYALSQIEAIMRRGGISTTLWDMIMGSIAIIVVLEATRRTVGNALPIIATVLTLYAFWGKHIPGIFGHGGYNYKRVITALYSYDGIFGTPVDVVATFVMMFIVFAAFLEKTGAGDFFLQLAKSLTGRQRGGPAKIATVASGFFGSISGSAVANVVGTGSFTIPLMKKMGYKPYFAGAVEAAASTGGQIMPPVMAAGAFLMAEILGVPYLQIMKAAVIPAVLYFTTIWITIDLRSAKIGLVGLPAHEVPSIKKIMRAQGYMLIPLLILVYSLVIVYQSPIRSAFWSMLSCIIIMLLQQRDLKKSLLVVVDALYESAVDVIRVAPACACAGIVIGAVGLTGLGLKIASVIVSFSSGNLWLTLILSMITALIFGMGLPTTVSYILCAAILAPALTQLGAVPIAAHMFIFYFACISGITPPVALAAYAGASIAGSDPMQTGFTACRLAIAGFILPYMFVYNPVFLMAGGTTGNVIWAIITALVGCYALAAASEGWLLLRANTIQRLILLGAALCLIKPGLTTDFIGFGSFFLVFFWQFLQRKKKGAAVETSPGV